MKTIALILAGGSGTRLWPLSRKNMPKQLLPLIGNKTLLQETCHRLLSFMSPKDQWVITSKEYYQQVYEQVQAVHDDIQVLEEPEGKNTAPAIFWAARRCQEFYGDDTVLLILPSDHLITNEKQFEAAIIKGIERAQEGFLVTFGIKPTHPETGYGYIEIETNQPKMEEPYPVKAFIEKPDKARAEQYIASGNYLWNSGMFAFHVGTLLVAGQQLCKNIAEPFVNSDPNDPMQIANAYGLCQAQSIDYAVMEKAKNIWVVPASFGWSDVGSWQSLFQLSPRDEKGNMLRGEHIVIDTNNCLIYGTERLIAVVGLESTVIVDTQDALLVCPLDQTQRVKEIVDELLRKAAKEL